MGGMAAGAIMEEVVELGGWDQGLAPAFLLAWCTPWGRAQHPTALGAPLPPITMPVGALGGGALQRAQPIACLPLAALGRW